MAITKICCEPAKFNDPKLSRTDRGDGYVVEAGPGDNLKFPYVDSCLAMAMALDNGWLIGGHVGMEWALNAGMHPLENAQKILGEMQARRSNRQGSVKFFIFVGDPGWWSGWGGLLPAVLPHLAAPIIATHVSGWQKGEGPALDFSIEGAFGSRNLHARCNGCGQEVSWLPLGLAVSRIKKLPDHHCA